MLEAVMTTLLTGIPIAVISAWVTVQLSQRRFRTERWWERKVQAYERVIAALHDSKAFADEHLEAEFDGRKLSEEQDKELRARSNIAHREIARAIDLGAFLLSDEALSRLRQHREDERNASEATNWQEYLINDLSASRKCLSDLIVLAKKDLHIN